MVRHTYFISSFITMAPAVGIVYFIIIHIKQYVRVGAFEFVYQIYTDFVYQVKPKPSAPKPNTFAYSG